MGSFSIWHWLIVAFIVLLLFGGKNKLSGLMGDMGKGLKDFKENFKGGEGEKNSTSTPAPSQDENRSNETPVINVKPDKTEVK